jgi:hypothetical protein
MHRVGGIFTSISSPTTIFLPGSSALGISTTFTTLMQNFSLFPHHQLLFNESENLF